MYGIIAYLFESENWYGSQLQILQGFAVKQKQTLMELAMRCGSRFHLGWSGSCDETSTNTFAGVADCSCPESHPH